VSSDLSARSTYFPPISDTDRCFCVSGTAVHVHTSEIAILNPFDQLIYIITPQAEMQEASNNAFVDLEMCTLLLLFIWGFLKGFKVQNVWVGVTIHRA